ncbi:MAG: transglycosylase SLT domain-containing protein, partial [Anaerolineales bacterium]
MNLGPRLVIPGTLICSTLLAILLLIVSAGTSYPPPIQAMAAQASTSTPQPLNSGSDGNGASVPAQDNSTSDNPGGACQVSGRFPGSILQWCSLITTYATKHGLDPDLVAALIWQESGGKPQAISRSGAVGLMQVMPRDGRAASFMCANGPCFSSRPTTNQLL